MSKRVVIYARLSQTSDESVSIARQLESAQQYAAARGWTVVGTFTDDGVSATHNKPTDRAGWRALLAASEPYDAVVIWKVDRLARRVLDFLNADAALQERDAGIVAVADPVDMTTPQGRAFATMLAVFAELEAAGISARVAAARRYLQRNGRVPGGTVPYGFQSVRNPDGAGYVLAQHPQESVAVRGMAERVLGGETIYGVSRWLHSEGIPSPTGKERWGHTTVERVLRHPALAGMTPYNPGNKKRQRGSGVLRDEDGLPVIDESVAVLPLGEWRRLQHLLDTRESPQSRPRSTKKQTSGLLSGLMWCARCGDQRMWRGTVRGRAGYYCKKCHQVISNMEDVVVQEFLRAKGDDMPFSRVEEVRDAGSVAEIQHRMQELTDLLAQTDDDAEIDRINEQLARLRELRRAARTATVHVVETPMGDSYAEAWAAAEDETAKRRVLSWGLARIWVSPGGVGKRSAAAKLERMRFEWLGPTS